MEDAHLVTFGLTIRERRMTLGLSQQILARKASLSKPFVGDLELGRRNPTLKSLVKLSAALEWKLTELLTPLNDLTPTRSS